MRIHCFQHTEYSGRDYFPQWAARHGHDWACTLVPGAGRLPNPRGIDCLVVLGGPMSAWQERLYPWLAREKRYLARFIASGKPVLGICLGAQLLADVLGARTYQGPHKEIGWFELERVRESRDTWIGAVMPPRFVTYLWHADTYDLPRGAVRIARSAAFENQGFFWNNVLALQFHLEVRPDWVEMLARRDAHELVPARHVQSAAAILGQPESLFRENNALMDVLLQRWLVTRAKRKPEPASA